MPASTSKYRFAESSASQRLEIEMPSVTTTPPTVDRRKGLIFKLVAVFISIVATLITLEVALRLYAFMEINPRAENTIIKARTSTIWMKSDDPTLIYVNRPNYLKDGVRQTESHGILRPQDVAMEKPQDVFRIALIGDSIAAAIYLDYPDRFGSLLETMLNESGGRNGKRVEVVNFAVNGYRTTQEAKLFETVGQKFDPDLVIIQYCMNDPGNSKTPAIWFLDDAPAPTSYLFDLVVRKMGGNSAEDSRITDAVPTFGPDYGTSDYWFKLYDPGSKSWRSVLEGFDRIDSIRRTRKIPVLIFIVPFLIDGEKQHAAAVPLHQRVREAGESHGWDVLDLMDLFERNTLSSLRDKPTDIYHPNQKGQDLIAHALLEKLRAGSQ